MKIKKKKKENYTQFYNKFIWFYFKIFCVPSSFSLFFFGTVKTISIIIIIIITIIVILSYHTTHCSTTIYSILYTYIWLHIRINRMLNVVGRIFVVYFVSVYFYYDANNTYPVHIFWMHRMQIQYFFSFHSHFCLKKIKLQNL